MKKIIYVKRIFSAILVLNLLIGMAACAKKDIEIFKTYSVLFSEDEIEDAIAVVQDYYDTTPELKEYTLNGIRYDEVLSQYVAQTFLGTSGYEHILSGDIIVIYVDFTTGTEPGPIDPTSRYADYHYVLVRNDKQSDWYIKEQGYA